MPSRVYIVDDEKDFCQSIEDLFRIYLPTCQCFSFHTAKDLMSFLDNKDVPQPDCIMLDLILPCGHGEELLERVLRSAPDIPIVVVSGHADSDLDRLLMGLGAQDVITKGKCEPEDMVKAVVHAVARQRYRRKIKAVQKTLEKAMDTTDKLSQLVDSQATKVEEAKKI